jgi:excisionase family DNA binding protein
MMMDELQELLRQIPARNLLKPAEVATLLSVSPKTVYRWCDMGLMDSMKLNKTVRILRASVVRFLEKDFGEFGGRADLD